MENNVLWDTDAESCVVSEGTNFEQNIPSGVWTSSVSLCTHLHVNSNRFLFYVCRMLIPSNQRWLCCIFSSSFHVSSVNLVRTCGTNIPAYINECSATKGHPLPGTFSAQPRCHSAQHAMSQVIVVQPHSDNFRQKSVSNETLEWRDSLPQLFITLGKMHANGRLHPSHETSQIQGHSIAQSRQTKEHKRKERFAERPRVKAS